MANQFDPHLSKILGINQLDHVSSKRFFARRSEVLSGKYFLAEQA
jgi:hypothetical protein